MRLMGTGAVFKLEMLGPVHLAELNQMDTICKAMFKVKLGENYWRE